MLLAVCWSLHLAVARAALDLGSVHQDDSDLTSFVSRPDIRAPRFNVSILHPELVAPGYWFAGPYASITQDSHARAYYQPCQTGPAIYDQYGELVWTGACLFRNQNACDFRTWRAQGVDYLSAVLWQWKDAGDKKGHGVILNSSFDVVGEIHAPKMMPFFNMHELNIVNDGRSVLYIAYRPVAVDLDGYEPGFDVTSGLIADLGIHEVELSTGELLFEWWSYDHIDLDQSTAIRADLKGPWPSGWNWIHLNSVDKSPEGDYLVSSRYTNAIYKISGVDGSLIWTLAGQAPKFSTFELEPGFNFSRQHDARFVSSTATEEVISFLDNGGDDDIETAHSSSSLIVTLDKVELTAKVTKRYIRPGDKRSHARANFQILPNGNAFSAWSDNCHISEHTPDGRLLFEAEFASKRFVTYRTWKQSFVGRPSEPPALKTFSYGLSPELAMTVHYVSWNGATEVQTWKFYRIVDGVESLIGERRRTGFETMFQSSSYEQCVIAEAYAADGSVLGRSKVIAAIIPDDWVEVGLRASTCGDDQEHEVPIEEPIDRDELDQLYDDASAKTEL